MKINFKKEGNTIHKMYELTETEQAVLRFTAQKGRINFRDLKYGEQNPWDETGTYRFEDACDLWLNGFIEEDREWLNTYLLSELGNLVVGIEK